MASNNVCILENGYCQSLVYVKKSGFIDLDDLALGELECLKYRAGLGNIGKNNLLCHHHHYYLKKYPRWSKVCCDPF